MEDLSLLEVFDLYARQAQVHVNLIPNFILYCQYSISILLRKAK
jgi:hypothetical protein